MDEGEWGKKRYLLKYTPPGVGQSQMVVPRLRI